MIVYLYKIFFYKTLRTICFFMCIVLYACSNNNRNADKNQNYPTESIAIKNNSSLDSEFTFDRRPLIKEFIENNKKIIVHDTIVQAFGDSVEVSMRFIPKENNKIVIPKIYYEELNFDSLVVNNVAMQVLVKGKRLYLKEFFKKKILF